VDAQHRVRLVMRYQVKRKYVGTFRSSCRDSSASNEALEKLRVRAAEEMREALYKYVLAITLTKTWKGSSDLCMGHARSALTSSNTVDGAS